jgi:hypothetical protein
VTNLSNIGTFLAHGSQELNSRHPLLCAQSCLTREVVHVRDQSLEDVLCPWVGALRVDAVYILRDVVYCEVFEDWDLNLWS